MQFESQSKLAQETHFLPHKRLLIIGFLFITALGIRLYHINEPPLEFHSTRQYRSFLIARGYFFESMKSIPEWKKRVASFSKEKQGIIEPPIMELVVSFAYSVVGGEHFWIPRLLSSIFWLIGGGFLYIIAKKIACADAALFSTAFYLFLPFAVVASRSFQPDPLMVMLLLASIFTILRYYDQPSTFRLAIAAVVSSLAFFIKPQCLFAILGVFVSLAVYRQGIRKSVISSNFLIFTVVSLLPTIIFYLYGIFIAGFFLEKSQPGFLPQILLNPFFWKGWLNNIGLVVGFTAFIGGLLGILMFREGQPRASLIGLWIGYLVFCLAFHYQVATHDYYQLQFIPIVALSIGPVVALIMNRLSQICTRRYWRIAVWSILLLALLLSIGVARSRLINPDFERKVKMAQEIGERVNHSTKTIFLSSDYGVPLEYHGLLSGPAWPTTSDLEWERLAGVRTLNAEERFNAWYLKDSPEYFIVMDFREFEGQPDLRDFLIGKFPIVAQNDDYLIFDLR